MKKAIALIIIFGILTAGCISSSTVPKKVTVNYNVEDGTVFQASNDSKGWSESPSVRIQTDYSIDLNTTNLTLVLFQLNWSYHSTEPDANPNCQVNMSLITPSTTVVISFDPSSNVDIETKGLYGNSSSNISAILSQVPNNITVEEKKLETFLLKQENINGRGTWTVHIKISVPVYRFPHTPSSVHWEIKIKTVRYFASLDRK